MKIILIIIVMLLLIYLLKIIAYQSKKFTYIKASKKWDSVVKELRERK